MRTVKADLDQARQEIEVPAAVPEGGDGQPMEEEPVEGITDAILERLSTNATVSNLDEYNCSFLLSLDIIQMIYLEINRAEKTKRA